jgi:CRP-like cAMP-binding protein
MYAVWLTIAVDRSYEPSTVRRLLLEAALSCSAVRKDPTPVVNVSDASGNPIRYTVYVHFRDYVSHFAGRNDLYMNIYGFLGRAGVVTAADKYEVSTEPAGERVLQMPSLREELRNVEFFSMLTEDQIDVLAEHASYHTFYPEEVIVREGKQDNSLFIITSGVVRVTKKDESGEDVEIARLGSGDVLGEMSLLTGEYRSATVTALVQVTVIQVTKEGLQPILQAVPQLSDTFAQVMLDRQLKSRQFLESMRLSKKSASDFVSDYLEAFVRSIRRFFRV